MKHANVALFIPDNGCPHACSFCSQRSITGVQRQPTPDDVRAAVQTALSSLGPASRDAEIAFFGGSFTAIEHGYMVSLLEAAAPYIRSGDFSGIRISTRPDAISKEILSVLRGYGVKTIELGAQSMDDHVLTLNGRGHTAAQTESAAEMIRLGGFSLGLQSMTGLMGDTDDGARETARRLAKLRPDCVRIYPTLTLRNTPLGEAYLRGEYHPQTLEEAVSLCAELLDFYENRGIPVIRLGLHASPELERNLLAGPWHPAFRELCESRRFLTGFLREFAARGISTGEVRVTVNPACVSQAVGQKRKNLAELASRGYCVSVSSDNTVPRGKFSII